MTDRATELRAMAQAATAMLSDGSDAAHSISDAARHAKLVADGRLRNAAPTIALELAYALDLLAEKDEELARLRGEPFPDTTGFYGLIGDAMREAEKAMRKFPQPNYVISKVAEEAGEVVKAAIHCAENRETAENLRGEMKQLIAMLYRLWVEGDGVHGLPSVRAALTSAPNAGNGEGGAG